MQRSGSLACLIRMLDIAKGLEVDELITTHDGNNSTFSGTHGDMSLNRCHNIGEVARVDAYTLWRIAHDSCGSCVLILERRETIGCKEVDARTKETDGNDTPNSYA